MFGTAVYFEGVACVAHGSRWVSDLRRGGGGGGGGGGYAAVWHERDPRGGGTLTRCATGDVRVLPRVCVFACGFSKILAQPCLSFGFARRVVCVCACVCAVSLCTCRAFLLVASSPPVPPNDAICDFYCPYRAFVTAPRGGGTLTRCATGDVRVLPRVCVFACGFSKIFGGCRPPKYLTDVCPSNIWGAYTPKIFDGCASVKYLGGVDP